jgi:UDPglucose 6-dehydrogenase
VLGLAYKPDTAVIDESQSILIARALAGAGARVLGHDPLAGAAARAAHGDAIHVIDDVQACIDAADIVLITTPDRAYTALRPEQFARGGRRRTVIDFWRVHSETLGASDAVDYRAAGRGEANEELVLALRGLWQEPALSAELT